MNEEQKRLRDRGTQNVQQEARLAAWETYAKAEPLVWDMPFSSELRAFYAGLDAAHAQSEPVQVSRAEIMLALHDEGAFCGWCDFEDAIFEDRSDGVEWRCKDCERHLGNYADAILTLLGRETVRDDAPTLCPVHGLSDCSPLLNGCSRLTAPNPERPCPGTHRRGIPRRVPPGGAA